MDPLDASEPTAALDARSAVASADAEASPAILGTVVGADLRPIAGARVWLFPSAIPSPEPGRALGRFVPETSLVTGDDGRFRFAVAGGESRAVLVDDAGHVAKWRNQEPGVDSPFELEVAARLYGSVAGAQVWASSRDWNGTSIDRVENWERADDAAGSYEVRGNEVGEEFAVLVVPDTGCAFTKFVLMERAGDLRRDIRLEARWIEGLVEDERSGAPVVGAVFSTWIPEGRRVVAESGLDGGFRVQIAVVEDPGGALDDTNLVGWGTPDPECDVDADGYLSSSLSLFQYSPLTLEVVPVSRVVLVPAGRIAGRVLLDGGLPAAGAIVTCLESAQLLVDGGLLGSSPRSRETRCDDEGRFALPEVQWGVHYLALDVRLGDLQRRVLGVSPPGPGATRELEIRLSAAPLVQGVVRWSGMHRQGMDLTGHGLAELPEADMQPLPIARIVLSASEGNAPRETESDAWGVFAFEDVAPGPYSLAATDEHGNRCSREVVVPTGAVETQTIELTLSPLP